MWKLFKQSGGAGKFDFKGLFASAKNAYGSVKGYAKPAAQNIAQIISPQQEGQKPRGFKSSLNTIINRSAPPQLPPAYGSQLPAQYYTPVITHPPPPVITHPPPPVITHPPPVITHPPPGLPVSPVSVPPIEYVACKQASNQSMEELQKCLQIIQNYEKSIQTL